MDDDSKVAKVRDFVTNGHCHLSESNRYPIPIHKTVYNTRNKICEYRTKILLPLALNTVHITWYGPVIPEITSKTIDKYKAAD